MQTSVFVFAYDLHDEGYGQVLDTLCERGGAGAVTMACSYHHARDVFPHGRRRKVRFLEGGAAFFRPDPARYRGLKIAPLVSRLAQEDDPLARCVAEAERRGMAVQAWTTNLHNSALGGRHPECCQQNAFGDPYIHSLCPANPDVRAYLAALSADIAGRGVQAVLLESIGYHGFDHGYHHERSFVPLSPATRFLLGLCFCEHCAAALRPAGVDVEHVRRFVEAEVTRVFDGEPGLAEGLPVTREAMGGLADGALGAMLDARRAVVTGLVAEIAEAVGAAGPARAIAMDMSGAALGYATGAPTGPLAHTRAWEDGLDLPELARACHGLSVLAYARDPGRVDADLAAYRRLLPAGTRLSVGMRPMPPDCLAAEEMGPKVAALRANGVESMDVYHYGLMRLLHLDWVGAALR
jgi:hypothetical protein